MPRHLEAGQPLRAKSRQLGWRHGGLPAQHDAGHADFTHALVGYRHHMGLPHGGVGGQQVFGVRRQHLLTATTVGLLAPAGQRQVALGVHARQVTGQQPAVGGEGLGCGLGLVVVAGGHARPPGQQFADVAQGHVLPGVRVDHAVDHQLAVGAAGTGRAYVTQPAVGGQQAAHRVIRPGHRAGGGHFGHAVAGGYFERPQVIDDVLPDVSW